MKQSFRNAHRRVKKMLTLKETHSSFVGGFVFHFGELDLIQKLFESRVEQRVFLSDLKIALINPLQRLLRCVHGCFEDV